MKQKKAVEVWMDLTRDDMLNLVLLSYMQMVCHLS